MDRSGHPNPVPRVVGPISRPAPVQVRDTAFLRTNTDRTIKVTVPGPFTMSQQTADVVAQRVRRVLPVVDAQRLVLAPDCGMKYLPRDSADGKLRAMTEAAQLLRTELGA